MRARAGGDADSRRRQSVRRALLLATTLLAVPTVSAPVATAADLVAEMTAAYEDLPLSYERVRALLRAGESGAIRTPRILYDEVVDGLERRVIDHLRSHREQLGLAATDALEPLEQSLARQIRADFALNVIDNAAQADFYLVEAAGKLSECGTPAYVTHPRGARFAVCVVEGTDGTVIVKTLLEQTTASEWVFRVEDGRYALSDILLPVDDALIGFLLMSK